MKEYRKYIEFAALVLLAGLLVWWFGRRLDWVQVKRALAHGDWRLIAVAFVIIGIAYLFRAMRWQAFLAPLTPSKLREVWVATTVGFAAVLLIGRMGEVVRPVVLPMREPRVRPAASFVTIMIERIYDVMTVVFIFAVNLLWFRPASGDVAMFSRVRQFGFALVVAGIVGLAALLWFRLKSAALLGWLDKRFSAMPRVPQRLKKAVLSLLEQLATALKVLSHPKDLAVTVGWTLVMWGSVVLGNLFVFRAFDLRVSGRPFGLTESLFILGWSMLGSAVPTPGGAAGAFHAATGAGLFFLGIEKEQAAAVAIVMHLVDFGPAALFGLFYFVRGEVNLDRLRNLTKPEAVEHAVEDEKIIPNSA